MISVSLPGKLSITHQRAVKKYADNKNKYQRKLGHQYSSLRQKKEDKRNGRLNSLSVFPIRYEVQNLGSYFDEFVDS